MEGNGGDEAHDPLERALDELETAVRALPFRLPVLERDARRALRDRLADDVAGQRARWRDRDAPLLVVLAGGTGAGKSTILNTLVGKAVAATGVIRPTTSSPTLVATPNELDWFTGQRVLPGLARVERRGRAPAGDEEGQVLHVVPSHALPAGLALVDAPDIDSVRTAHRDLADGLLDAADVWLWLATGRTYADEEGMAYLRRAVRRRTALGVVLTQVHDREAAPIRDDLRAKLAAEGLDGATVAIVPFARVEAERLPVWAIEELRTWLWDRARPGERERLRRQTLDGALDDLRAAIAPLVAAADEERAAVRALADDADRIYGQLRERVSDALEEGLPLRQELLAQWTQLVGGARFAELVESATGALRGWVRGALAGRAGAEEQRVERRVRAELGAAVTTRLVDVLDLLAAETCDAWAAQPVGAELLAAEPALRRTAADVRERAGVEVAAWQETVAELIRTKGAERRVRARWLSTVVNAAATAAILAAFATTGGLTGVEVGIAASASAVNQWLLTKVLGEQNVRWLLDRIRGDLLDRAVGLGTAERARFDDVLAGLAADQAVAERVTAALDGVDDARGRS